MERKLITCSAAYYDLYLPNPRKRPAKSPLIIGLHGYSGNKESMMRLLRKINETDFALAAIDAPYRFFLPPKDGQASGKVGFCWHTSYRPEDSIALHHDILHGVIQNCVSAGIDPARIFLLGFSQPVSLNYRFVFTYPEIIHRVWSLFAAAYPETLNKRLIARRRRRSYISPPSAMNFIRRSVRGSSRRASPLTRRIWNFACTRPRIFSLGDR